MKYEWIGKTILKKYYPKIEKTVKIKVKLPNVNKKTTSEKANFCSNSVFSHYFKIRAKNFRPQNHSLFSLHFLFRRDQNHFSNLTSKTMKLCEQILKKTAGRIPERTRSGNPFKRHPTTYQTKHDPNYIRLS